MNGIINNILSVKTRDNKILSAEDITIRYRDLHGYIKECPLSEYCIYFYNQGYNKGFDNSKNK